MRPLGRPILTKGPSIGKMASGDTDFAAARGGRPPVRRVEVYTRGGFFHAGKSRDRGGQHRQAEGAEKRGNHGASPPDQGGRPGGPPPAH